MRLSDLEPEWLVVSRARGERGPDGRFVRAKWGSALRMVDRIDDADGLWLLCPACFVANNGRVGTHGVICWRPRVPQTITPVPGRWEFEGSSFDDLTLVAGSSSIKLVGGCNAHFFIRCGAIVMA